MKILLLQSSTYLPAYGGANKVNRAICELLAQRGHQCEAMATYSAVAGTGPQPSYCDLVRLSGAEMLMEHESMLVFRSASTTVFAFPTIAQLRSALTHQITHFKPDIVLISSEDPYQTLLQKVITVYPGKIVYIAHTPLLLPFGPASICANAGRTAMLEQMAGIITISHFMQEYLLKWANLQSTVIPVPVFGPEPLTPAAKFAGAVTMVNPCAYKGMSIFLRLAQLFPSVSFKAIPSWGTTRKDITSLSGLHNIAIGEANPDISQLLSDTSILLVPSLCLEGFGLLVIDSMLRGIPVIASNVGGLPESKRGVDYVIPVREIQQYLPDRDEIMLPVPLIPFQDIDPWKTALTQLLESQSHFEKIASSSRLAALSYVRSCNIVKIEQYLENIVNQ